EVSAKYRLVVGILDVCRTDRRECLGGRHDRGEPVLHRLYLIHALRDRRFAALASTPPINWKGYDVDRASKCVCRDRDRRVLVTHTFRETKSMLIPEVPPEHLVPRETVRNQLDLPADMGA